MRLGIIGGGVVGNATARVFMEHGDIRIYDTDITKKTHQLDKVLECDLIFICLPTPATESGRCDTSIITGVLAGLGQMGYLDRPYVLRSTVPIGFTRRIASELGLSNICHSPEFLTARCSVVDAHCPSRNVIGLVNDWENANYSSYILKNLYRKRFPGVPLIVGSSEESEAIKLCVNAFFATKVGFFNEIYRLAEAYRLDWNVVLSGMMTDGRITHSHNKVPGPDGKYGFGGECLPKDLSNLIQCFFAVQVEEDNRLIGPRPTILQAVARRNERDRDRK